MWTVLKEGEGWTLETLGTLGTLGTLQPSACLSVVELIGSVLQHVYLNLSFRNRPAGNILRISLQMVGGSGFWALVGQSTE